MAVLRSYYWLCALPGAAGRFPLGVAPDVTTASGLATLGPHLIARYTFSDQKQVGGWVLKDVITSPAVYDKTEKSYLCVVNENAIKVWNGSTENLDKVKKVKFHQAIFKLIPNVDNTTILIFKDGSCAALSYALEAKKNLESVNLLEKDETILKADIFESKKEKHVCYITKSSNGLFSIITCQLETDINTVNLESLKRVRVERTDLPNGKVIGISISSKAEVPQVHIMWSDGRLFGVNLVSNETHLVGHVPYVNNNAEVSMVWIGEKHIAIYGADMAQEGAILIVFNVLFGIVTYRYPLKLYCAGAQVWCLPDNLILESHQHLAVVPYVLSSNRNVLSLIGSSRDDKESKNVATVDWGKGKFVWEPKEEWCNLAKQGISERDISLQFFPTLLEHNNVDEIKNALEEFKDIPEDLIVNLLLYTLKKFPFKFDSSFDELKTQFSASEEFRLLMSTILNLSFTKDNLIPHLRNNLNTEFTIVLLKYLNYLLCDQTDDTKMSMDFEEKIIIWSSCLVDSHFQEFLLSADKQCFETIDLLKSSVDDLINGVGSIESVLPLLSSLKSKQKNKNVNVNDALYYIEEIKLC